MRKDNLHNIYTDALAIKIANDVTMYNGFEITKQAGLWDDLGFEQIASSIKSFVKNELVKEDSPEGYLKALGNLLISGALFKFNKVIGIAYAVANAMGIDVIGIASDVFNGIKDALLGGNNFTESDFNQIAKSAFASYPITKFAQTPSIPFLPEKNQPLIARIFGNLFMKGKRTSASWLAKGIIIWTLKTALLGAGLLTGAGALASFFRKDEPKDEVNETSKEIVTKKNLSDEKGSSYAPTKGLKPSGMGERRFANDGSNMWIVPIFGTIEDTLIAWTEEIYPQLSGYDYILEKSREFNRVANLLKENVNSRTNSILVPQEFHSRKDIVDLFAPAVAKQEGLI